MASQAGQKVWFITGTSSGLGREIALAALARNDKVILTARSIQKIQDIEEANKDICRVMQMDVTDNFKVLQAKAREAVGFWGKVDVLVNNAGYGHFGLLEEGGSEALQQIFNTNVFGAVNVTNAILPYMRERHGGTVVMIGSRSAHRTKLVRSMGVPKQRCMVCVNNVTLPHDVYAAPAALTDALAEEIKPFGIQVITAVPGGIGSEGVANSILVKPNDLLVASQGENEPRYGEVPEYTVLRNHLQTVLYSRIGREPGSARKAAGVIVDVVRSEGVAAGKAFDGTLFLGSDCKNDVTARCKRELANLEEWSDVASSVDVDKE